MEWYQIASCKSHCPSRLSGAELNQLTIKGRLLVDQQHQKLLQLEKHVRSQRRPRDRTYDWREEHQQKLVRRDGLTRSFCRENEGFVSVFTFLILSFNFFFGLSGILNYRLRVFRRPHRHRYSNSNENNSYSNSTETVETSAETVETTILSALTSQSVSLGTSVPSLTGPATDFFLKIGTPFRQFVQSISVGRGLTFSGPLNLSANKFPNSTWHPCGRQQVKHRRNVPRLHSPLSSPTSKAG